ncbi:MAG: response regulator transcription factor, partial [Planctomycetota bacterium]|nr:response regulator transcription factor [Planctomycetota bacterium]
MKCKVRHVAAAVELYMRLLVVEDSVRIREALEQGLRRRGYAVDAVGDGRQALIHARTTSYDVIILDIMLPELNGLDCLKLAREQGVESAVLLLTARDAVEDRVRGLQCGADDYLVKPFAFEELVARVQALARRKHWSLKNVVRIADLEIDIAAKQVRRAGIAIELAPREFAVLEYLAHRSPNPIS